MKRVSAHVLAATAVASFILLWVSAMPAYAFASPNPHPNPDNNGNHYGWYKHPPTPPPLPTPKPTSQPTPHTPSGTTAPGTVQGNQDPPAPQAVGADVSPAAILLPGEPKIVVVDVKGDDLPLWVIYLLLAALALLWVGLVGAATVRSVTGRPAPRRA